MTFAQTVMAVVMGHAIYDVLCAIFLREDDDDDPASGHYAR